VEDTLYKVKTTQFEGPLEVLLDLIEKRKLFINEISLASITDDFITYVHSLPRHDLDAYASFISVAATLILIKSRSLIPNLELSAEEEQDVSALERRLELYKLIKEIGVEIAEQFGKHIIFPRLENNIELKVFAPDVAITSNSMFANIQDVIKALPEDEVKKPEVAVMKIKSLEETISDVIERVTRAVRTSFRELSAAVPGEGKEKKVGVIVSFLAMLELVRNGFMDASQENEFDDINLQKIN
jgi:segregation and condensation protein A